MLAKNCCRFWFKFRATSALEPRRLATPWAKSLAKSRAALWVVFAVATALKTSSLQAQDPPAVASEFGAEAEAERVDWKVDGKLRQQLQLPADVVWREKPLRDGLINLSRRQQVAVFLDRRVNPDQRVDFTGQNLSLAQLFAALAIQQELAVGQVGPVIYIGPPATAKKLATLVQLREEQVRRLPAAVQRRWLHREPIRWPILAEPRELLKQAADSAGLRIEHLDRVPHDLWPATDLPPLNAIEQLALILAGFGVTYEISADGAAVRPLAIPDEVSIRRGYAWTADPAGSLARLREMFPDTKFAMQGSRLEVDGPWETHEHVERLLRGETVRAPVAGPTISRFTLTVRNQSARAVLQAVAAKLGLQLEIAPTAANQVNEMVNFAVDNVSLEDLLTAICKPVGLQAQATDTKLRVTPL